MNNGYTIQKGRNQLKEEFSNKLKENADRALYWSEKNLCDLKTNGKLGDKWRLGSLELLLRPAQKFKFFGLDCRISGWKTDFNWIISEEDYQTLRKRSIEIVFSDSNIKKEEYEEITSMYGESIKENMYAEITKKVDEAWKTIAFERVY